MHLALIFAWCIFFISYIFSSEVVLLKWDWDVVDLRVKFRK